jgi:uncharacterized protein
MSTRQEQLITILDNLTSQTAPDVSGAVAVSMDGIVFASRLSNDVNADRVGAVAATTVGVTRRVSNELKIGATDEAIARVL